MTDPGAPADRVRTARRRLLQPLWNGLDAHLDPARGALLAVSGGPDSRALLEAVARWPRRFDGPIRVACVDHRTRPESAAEADAVVARARVLGFDGSVLRLEEPVSGEGPLRDARYTALVREAAAHGLASVVVAHHAGDAAENVLLSWLGRGGGPLAGRRAAGPVEVVRPFVALPRAALRMALLACGVDDSFADPDAVSARSRLRGRLLALLGPDRGDVEERLAIRGSRAADDDAALRALAAGLVTDDGPGAFRLVRSPELALLRRALRLVIGRVAPDPRDSAAGVEIAARLMRDRRAGHVDAAGAFIDVDGDGNARVTRRVAAGPPPTHDGRAGPRLSGEPRVRTLAKVP